jgi:hypothetical protein
MKMSNQIFHCLVAGALFIIQSLAPVPVQAEREGIRNLLAIGAVPSRATDGEPRIRVTGTFQFDRSEEEIGSSPKIEFSRSRGIGQVTFLYEDDDFDSVAVSGDFNEWNTEPMELDSTGGIWQVRVDVDPGRYSYRYIVWDDDGEWEAIDPNNDSALRDSEYGWVSRFRVKTSKRSYRARPDHLYYTKHELGLMHGTASFGLDYQRVDGLFLFVSPGAYSYHTFGTSLKAKIGYGFKSEEWSISGTLAQPLLPSGRLQLLVSGYGATAYTDQTGVGDLENILAAVLFKEDFRDYYRREGFSAQLVYTPYRHLRFVGGFRTEDYTSMGNNASWSLASGDFLPNPPVQEGTLRSAFGEAQFGSDLTHLRVNYETCGDDVAGGDYEFEQLTAQIRKRTYLGRDKRFDMRVKYGTTLSGRLPNQRRYLVGGLGTVRGYDYQSLLITSADDSAFADTPFHGGQQMLLANAEFKFGFNFGWLWFDDWDWDWDDDWDRDFDFDLALFFDMGMAWTDRDANIDLRDLKSSAGIGLLFGDDDDLRLDFIQVLDEKDKDLVVQIRIKRMF